MVILANDTLKVLKLSLLSAGVDRVQSIWSIVVALTIGCFCATFIGRKRLAKCGGIIKPINSGATSSVMAILNTASGYAFGFLIASLAGFQIVKNSLLNLHIGNSPLLSEIITTNLMSAITGSASGGLTIALGMLGNEWLIWAQSIAMPPEVLHRIICLASEGFDTVPHSGALVTLIAVCGLTHKESYYDIFMLTMMKPIIALFCWWIYSMTGVA